MQEPIEKFNTQEQLDASLREWQHRLSLDHWTIRAKIVPECEFMLDGENAGECEYQHVGNAATVRLRKWDEVKAGEWIQKQPQELVLVHELLHCKFFMPKSDSFENRMFEEYEHQKQEEIAKALIMAKYNLTLDWFKA